jgi:17beta-estradiol 17-dehydrogenase / very-long-chain 3-oxoacyl-CoA reductase
VSTIYRRTLRRPIHLSTLGKYAIVTGATDGIGRAYAFALAKRGMSLILISRSETKLLAMATEIDNIKDTKGKKAGQGKVPSRDKTRIIVCDYSNFNTVAQAHVSSQISNLDIGILINNVGISYRYPMYYHELSTSEVSSIIDMNINSTVLMTHLVLPGMVQRQRGTILNIASGSALYSMPLLAEYGAAKMFITRFSQSLDAEYSSMGIRIQCQVPFYVATKLAKLRKSISVPTANEYVNMGIQSLGYGGYVVQPYWLHALQGYIMTYCIPSIILDTGVKRMHESIRQRGMKKDAATATTTKSSAEVVDNSGKKIE